MTNGDKIRQMSDEELAEYLGEAVGCMFCPADEYCHSSEEMQGSRCSVVVGAWLKQEAKDE